MALIDCHECGKQVSTTAVSCPNCGAKVIAISGKNWAAYDFKHKVLAVVAWLVMSILTSWALMSGLEWLVGGHGQAMSFVSAFYWWFFGGLAFLVFIEFFKALDRGDFNR